MPPPAEGPARMPEELLTTVLLPRLLALFTFNNPELTLMRSARETGAFRNHVTPALPLTFITSKLVMAPIVPPPAPRLTVFVPAAAAVSRVGSWALLVA